MPEGRKKDSQRNNAFSLHDLFGDALVSMRLVEAENLDRYLFRVSDQRLIK